MKIYIGIEVSNFRQVREDLISITNTISDIPLDGGINMGAGYTPNDVWFDYLAVTDSYDSKVKFKQFVEETMSEVCIELDKRKDKAIV